MAGYTPGEQPQAGKFIKLNTNENPYPSRRRCARAIERVLRARAAAISRPDGDCVSHAGRRGAGRRARLDSVRQRQRRHSDDLSRGRSSARANCCGCRIRATSSTDAGRSFRAPQARKCASTPIGRCRRRSPRRASGLKLAFLPNPNSPSGTMMPPRAILRARRAAALPAAGRRSLRRFRRRRTASTWSQQNEKILVSRTLSKSYALAGLRFGYLVAQPQIIEQLVKVKDSYNCDALSIAGATAAIDDQAWLAENRAKILATRGRLTAGHARTGLRRRPTRRPTSSGAPHPQHAAQAALRAAQSQRSPGPLHELSRLGRRPADFSVGTDEQIDALLEPAADDGLDMPTTVDNRKLPTHAPHRHASTARPPKRRSRLELNLDGSGQGADRHRRRLPRPHADAVGQARGDRSDGRGQGRSARRSAPHGRRRRHLPRPGAASRRSATRPASAATATSRCRWKRRWPPRRSTSQRPLRPGVSAPISQRPRSATSTASWSKISGKPSPPTPCATCTSCVHYGRNSHHISEAIFKATARALRMAVEADPRMTGVPSTKGTLYG